MFRPKFIPLPETNSLPLKIDGWKMIRLPFGAPHFFAGTGAMLVFREVFWPYFTNLKMAETEIRNEKQCSPEN